MKLEVKNISNSLNKAYLAQSLYFDEISLFKENYATLLKSIKPTDNEETLKDYINNFFRDTYYKNKFTIKENINNIDLVIYNGKDENDKIGVIIETKALKNNAEMITKDDLNKKAFQELLQYYLEERIINNNIEIKHLIITNSIDWFIFNVTEFERIFYQNKALVKKFNDWYNGHLESKNKDWFYSSVAKPFIENEQENINCSYFQLSESSKLSESSLIELYKIFSPEHLLKLPFQNDSNTLNREFYNELLHIIGLQEIKEKGVKKISRLNPKNREEASLIENTINILQSDEIIHNLKDAERFGETEEEQLFSISLELCITWLNRILFLKLLESQIVKYNSNKEYLFLNYSKIRDFEELRELFFEVLAVKPAERKKFFQTKYEKIPYLNSSLFELTDLEKETVKINQLNSHSEIQIFNATVLKDENGRKISGSKPILQYLFDFLDSYNFASDIKAEIQEKNKTIINSSVLGLIFEKINGYKEGSYYTPGFVTMYMCSENIRKAVVEKFKTDKEFAKVNSIADIHNSIDISNIKKANDIFNSIKICDPAVGSGHFLVSALNELIAIKSELKIITDNEGKKLRDVQIEVINDELFITVDSELFTYNYKKPESQKIQETIFREKQKLIENCLFGVDINPKSVNICRLRLWIELLKNAYYTKESNYKELETLPNIDINIKCGNSLISHFSLNGNGNSQSLKTFTQKYKQVVSEYKNTTDRNAKRTLERFIAEQKENFARTVNPNDEDLKKIRKIESEIGTMPMFFNKDEQTQWQMKLKRLENEKQDLQKQYNDKLKSIYSNSFEWRFEFPEVLDENGYFIGFDLIIGNPPYISAVSMARNDLQKAYFKNNYPEATGSYDIYILFLKRATEILKQNGIYTWIIPNKFLDAIYAQNTKELLINSGLSTSIDISHINVFEKASVYPIIISGINKSDTTDFKQFRAEKEADLSENKLKEYTEQTNYKTFAEVGIKIMSGATGFEAQKLKPLITEKQTKNSIPFVVSGCIDKYSIEYENVRYMRTTYKKAFIQNNNKTVATTKWSFWNNKKIVIAGMTKSIEAIWSENPLAIGVGTYGIYDFSNFEPKFILALLNSKFLSDYVIKKFRNKHLAGGYLAINKNMIEKFPIVEVSNKEQQPFIKLVDKILEVKKENPNADTQKLEQEIDSLVYKIYKLTKQDIELINK